MSREAEFTGKSVDAAIAEAEEAFGKPRDDLDIRILSQGSRGVFGLGGEPARIQVRDPSTAEPEPNSPVVESIVREPEPLAVQAAAVDFQVETDFTRPVSRRRGSRRAEESGDREESGSQVAADEIAPAAQEILETLLEKMGFDAAVSIRENEDPVTLDVKGDNLGILIGRRGDSLASLQFMVNVILSKQFKTWPRVVIDIQGYRARREQSLSSLGQRVADRVRRNRRPFTLEAMPASDRRIIHLTLQERADVETYSIGEGQSRRVVVAPKR